MNIHRLPYTSNNVILCFLLPVVESGLSASVSNPYCQTSSHGQYVHPAQRLLTSVAGANQCPQLRCGERRKNLPQVRHTTISFRRQRTDAVSRRNRDSLFLGSPRRHRARGPTRPEPGWLPHLWTATHRSIRPRWKPQASNLS